MPIEVLALDLEATLINNAWRAEPRPGLVEFLEYCHRTFPRVALFTSVAEPEAREVVAKLVSAGHWPQELATRLEYVDWSGPYKDLAFVANAQPSEIVLVDDDVHWVRPDQRGQWIAVSPWHGTPDTELLRVREELAARLGSS